MVAMRDDLGAPWHYEPKSRCVIDAEGYVLAVLTGQGMERGAGDVFAGAPILFDALQLIAEGWLSGPEAAERAAAMLESLERHHLAEGAS